MLFFFNTVYNIQLEPNERNLEIMTFEISAILMFEIIQLRSRFTLNIFFEERIYSNLIVFCFLLLLFFPYWLLIYLICSYFKATRNTINSTLLLRKSKGGSNPLGHCETNLIYLYDWQIATWKNQDFWWTLKEISVAVEMNTLPYRDVGFATSTWPGNHWPYKIIYLKTETNLPLPISSG